MATDVAQSPFRQALGRMFGNTSVLLGGSLALLIALMGIFAPYLDTRDPSAISPANRNAVPGEVAKMRDLETGQRIEVSGGMYL